MKAAIIGGGISGLAMALAFEKVGLDYTLYEKADELNEVGAGIWVSVNALKVFEWTGTVQKLIKRAVTLEKLSITDRQFNLLQNIDQKTIKRKTGYSNASIHRAVLQKCLYDELPPEKINLGYEVESLETTAKGTVILHFTNGKQAQADYVVAADGIHSAIRTQLWGECPLRDTGQLCWRGVSDIKLEGDLQKAAMESWGYQIRFGFSVISQSQVYWFAVTNSHNTGEHLSKEELLNLFADFNPVVSQIIVHTPEEKIIFRQLKDLKPIKTWHQNRVVLIGDAAHATTPNLGQGAAQGIEDAYYLSQYLETAVSVEEAFTKFEKQRRKKVNNVVSTSWQTGKIAHLKYGRSIRNFVFRHAPKSMMTKRMIKLYTLSPL